MAGLGKESYPDRYAGIPSVLDWLSGGRVNLVSCCSADTGMPTLGCRHWDADTIMARRDVQLREHRPFS